MLKNPDVLFQEPRPASRLFTISFFFLLLLFLSSARAADKVMVLGWSWQNQRYEILQSSGGPFSMLASHKNFSGVITGTYDWGDDGTSLIITTDNQGREHLTVFNPQGNMKFNPLLSNDYARSLLAIFHSAIPTHALGVHGFPHDAVSIIEKATGKVTMLYQLPPTSAFRRDMFAYDKARNLLYYAASPQGMPSTEFIYESSTITGQTQAIHIVPQGFSTRNAAVEPTTGGLVFSVYGGPGVENLGIILNQQLILNTPLAILEEASTGKRDVTIDTYAIIQSGEVTLLDLQNNFSPTIIPLPGYSIYAVGLKR